MDLELNGVVARTGIRRILNLVQQCYLDFNIQVIQALAVDHDGPASNTAVNDL